MSLPANMLDDRGQSLNGARHDPQAPHFKGDLVDLASEARLGADADAESDRRLIVDADVGRLVRREDIGLSLLDARLYHADGTSCGAIPPWAPATISPTLLVPGSPVGTYNWTATFVTA